MTDTERTRTADAELSSTINVLDALIANATDDDPEASALRVARQRVLELKRAPGILPDLKEMSR